uniref:Retrovirus-related Pol polyprotein from transposon TNT 1-94 n=1 Tax=Tanacetum cinerariifolium TaxID=118510 RepID=A0A699HNS4_TANCI|nr:retrovirus-related Pol polyprotein from transposon TNT 1-94 [Tanacetum cinerariifolium]
MNVEMQSMKDNEVWNLVDLPPNGKTVGSKWLFKKKIDMDGVVHTYKACLVAKGFTQTPGIDYEETFSLVADTRAIRILIAIVVFNDCEIWKMDVKTAFLNGYLTEEVYIEQPGGFVNPKFPNRVCKLKRFIYGLKQASRQWNKRFDDEIKKFSFNQNCNEPCVYMKASGSYVTFLILYVDDILIMENNISMLQDVKSYLGRCFAMKDLGEVEYILGIKIYRDRSKRLIGLCQSAYIEKILKRFFIDNSKRGHNAMQEKLKLSKSHDMFLAYGGDINRELRVSCYTDAGYLMDAGDLKSHIRYVFVLNGDATKEAAWVRKFIDGLGVVPIIKEPIQMYCDNTRAITMPKFTICERGPKGGRPYVFEREGYWSRFRRGKKEENGRFLVPQGPGLEDDEQQLDTKNELEQPLLSNDNINNDDNSDDDWEGVESSELDEAFSTVTAFVAATAADKEKNKVSSEVQSELYNCYKIATKGPCTAPQPSALKFTPWAKWYICEREVEEEDEEEVD